MKSDTGFSLGSAADLVCHEGLVTRIEDGVAYVRVERPKSCDGCASQDVCDALSSGVSVIQIRGGQGVSVGRRVKLGLKPAAVVTASFLLFLAPVVTLIIGVVGGYLFAEWMQLDGKQWYGLAAGVIAFSLALLIVGLLTPRFERSGKYEPVITEVLD